MRPASKQRVWARLSWKHTVWALSKSACNITLIAVNRLLPLCSNTVLEVTKQERNHIADSSQMMRSAGKYCTSVQYFPQVWRSCSRPIQVCQCITKCKAQKKTCCLGSERVWSYHTFKALRTFGARWSCECMFCSRDHKAIENIYDHTYIFIFIYIY